LHRAVITEKAYIHELLGKRAAAFDNRPGDNIALQCPEDPFWVEAQVPVKTAVLDADRGIHKNVGKISSNGVGQLERPSPSELFAIRRFKEKRRLAVAADGLFRWKTIKRPNHCAGRRQRAKQNDNDNHLDQPADHAAEYAAGRFLAEPQSRMPQSFLPQSVLPQGCLGESCLPPAFAGLTR